MDRLRQNNSVDSLSGGGVRLQPKRQPNHHIQAQPGTPLGFGVPKPEPRPNPRVLSLEIKLPKLPKFKLPKLPPSRTVFKLVLPMIIILIFIFLIVRISGSRKGLGGDRGDPGVVDPGFKAVTPLGKPDITKVQGATSTYDAEKKVLSYTDSYAGKTFTISQQLLPDTLKSDTEALGKLATNLGSKRLLDTRYGQVYVSTNIKTKEETAIITTDKVLIFIRAPHQVDDSTWKEYINKLSAL